MKKRTARTQHFFFSDFTLLPVNTSTYGWFLLLPVENAQAQTLVEPRHGDNTNEKRRNGVIGCLAHVHEKRNEEYHAVRVSSIAL